MPKYLTLMFIIILAPWFVTPAVHASIQLPRSEPVPGGVAIVKLPKSNTRPEVYLDNSKIAVVEMQKFGLKTWVAIVGLPLTLEPGVIHLQVVSGGQSSDLPIKIKSKKYPKERIWIKQAEKVKPDPILTAKIEEEQKELEGIFSSWHDYPLKSFYLQRPSKGRITSGFGKQRLLNGEVQTRHKGIDIAGKRGTPIIAARAGNVLLAKKYVLTGNTVVIDHGLGFKTIYCHLDKIEVKPGDFVDQKVRIGTIGSTGRATGPHLHFGVSLNNVRVSPNLFFMH